MDGIFKYEIKDPIEDYKKNKCKAYLPSIVLSLLIVCMSILVFISLDKLIIKISLVVGCVFVVCLIITFAFTVSPRTNFTSIKYKEKDMFAYVTNFHGESSLNLWYEGVKYTKSFNRKKDYEFITMSDVEDMNEGISLFETFGLITSAVIVANIFNMIGWNLKSKNKCITLVQDIEENQIIVVYDLKRNKIVIDVYSGG